MAGGVMRPSRYIVIGMALFTFPLASTAQQLRDPTRPHSVVRDKAPSPKAKKSTPRSKMVLQSILIAEDRQSAVISGQLVSVGDTISGFRVSEIRIDEVVLRKGKNKTRVLQLFPDVHLSDSNVAMSSKQEKGQR